jgi:nicotinamidase-related amidase
MPELKTLRDVAALGAEPNQLHEPALVMIDCQNTYREGVMRLVGVEAALDEAQRLLSRARAAGIPIFHVMHDAGPGSPYDISASIGQISDQVSPGAGEPVIVEHYPNAFVGTELDTLLRNCGKRNLLLAGFMTHMCVNSTARGAFNLGYRPTVIGSATATRDLPGPDRSVVTAPVMQAASLAALADLFAVVVDKADDIPAWSYAMVSDRSWSAEQGFTPPVWSPWQVRNACLGSS